MSGRHLPVGLLGARCEELLARKQDAGGRVEMVFEIVGDEDT